MRERERETKIESSVTRSLDNLFNIRPFTIIAKLNCHSKCRTQNNPDQNYPRLLKFCQSGKISPNPVTPIERDILI